MAKKEGKSYHMCMNIKGAILNWNEEEMRGIFEDDDGLPMSNRAAKSHLLDLLSDGHKVIPIGKCDNFDKINGCQGHPVTEEGGLSEEIKAAFSVLDWHEPCGHETVTENLGNGKIWAKCEDCDLSFKQEALAAVRQQRIDFCAAMDTIKKALKEVK